MTNECSLNIPRLVSSQYVRMSRWNESVVHQSLHNDSIFRIIDFAADFSDQKEPTNVAQLVAYSLVVQSYFRRLQLFLRLMLIGRALQAVVGHPKQKTFSQFCILKISMSNIILKSFLLIYNIPHFKDTFQCIILILISQSLNRFLQFINSFRICTFNQKKKLSINYDIYTNTEVTTKQIEQTKTLVIIYLQLMWYYIADSR